MLSQISRIYLLSTYLRIYMRSEGSMRALKTSTQNEKMTIYAYVCMYVNVNMCILVVGVLYNVYWQSDLKVQCCGSGSIKCSHLI